MPQKHAVPRAETAKEKIAKEKIDLGGVTLVMFEYEDAPLHENSTFELTPGRLGNLRQLNLMGDNKYTMNENKTTKRVPRAAADVIENELLKAADLNNNGRLDAHEFTALVLAIRDKEEGKLYYKMATENNQTSRVGKKGEYRAYGKNHEFTVASAEWVLKQMRDHDNNHPDNLHHYLVTREDVKSAADKYDLESIQVVSGRVLRPSIPAASR